MSLHPAKLQEPLRKSRNGRLVAVVEQSLLYGDMKDLSDLDPKLLKQIETFFVNYQKVRDVEFKILARQGAHQAVNMVKRTKNRRAA